MTAKPVSASAISRHLDLSRQRIAQLVDEGVIERRPDDRFDQGAARVAYLRWLRSEDRRGQNNAAGSGRRGLARSSSASPNESIA